MKKFREILTEELIGNTFFQSLNASLFDMSDGSNGKQLIEKCFVRMEVFVNSKKRATSLEIRSNDLKLKDFYNFKDKVFVNIVTKSDLKKFLKTGFVKISNHRETSFNKGQDLWPGKLAFKFDTKDLAFLEKFL